MDPSWMAVSYAVRISIPIFSYRWTRFDGNSKRASLMVAAATAGLFQLAEASLSGVVY